jgi:hypothetical protein
MSDGDLWFWSIPNDCTMANVGDEQNARGKRPSQWPYQGPACPPWFSQGRGQGPCRLFKFGQRHGNDFAALLTHGEMVEYPYAFVQGQRLLDEGADLIGVWMVPELERLAHVGSVAAADAV